MRVKDFYDERQASAYLKDSIIRKGNVPIMITSILNAGSRKWRLNYNVIGEDDTNIMFMPNTEINMNPVPLGMMNLRNNVYFVSRSPVRSWKIGLDRHNINFSSLVNSDALHSRPSLSSSELKDCIMGKYPDFDSVLQEIKIGTKMKAFSRRFAVVGGSLRFKSLDDPVGIAERTGPVLFDNYSYLQEVLEDDLNG